MSLLAALAMVTVDGLTIDHLLPYQRQWADSIMSRGRAFGRSDLTPCLMQIAKDIGLRTRASVSDAARMLVWLRPSPSHHREEWDSWIVGLHAEGKIESLFVVYSMTGVEAALHNAAADLGFYTERAEQVGWNPHEFARTIEREYAGWTWHPNEGAWTIDEPANWSHQVRPLRGRTWSPLYADDDCRPIHARVSVETLLALRGEA